MPNRLKCPLLSAPIAAPTGQVGFAVAGCLGSDCSWWDPFRNQCYTVTTAQLLPRVSKKEDDKPE